MYARESNAGRTIANLRAVVAGLTGIEQLGVVSLKRDEAHTVYRVCAGLDILVCRENAGTWRISRFNAAQKEVACWSTAAADGMAGAMALQWFLDLAAYPPLIVQANDLERGIVRARFGSPTGELRVHSRRGKTRDDFILEEHTGAIWQFLVAPGSEVRVAFDRSKGCRVDTVPF